MRIGIVSPEFPPDIGGVETYAFEYSKELAKRGYEVTVFTLQHSQGEVSLPGGHVCPVLTMRWNLDRRILARYRMDVWHAMNAAYAWLALEEKSAVVTVHGNDFLRPYSRMTRYDPRELPFFWRFSDMDPSWMKPVWSWRMERLLSRALPRAKAIIANSHYTQQALLERYPVCQGKTSVAYVGVAEHYFGVDHRRAADGVPRLLTVCRLSEPRKNVDLVIRALATLKDRHSFSYTIVGDGHDRERLEGITRDLGLQDRVRFTGFVSSIDLLRTYSEADLFVLTSSILPGSHEGFGIVYLEAAASGVPSLAARLAGAAEAVTEGVSGLFVDTPSVEAITDTLKQFLEGGVTFEREACRQFAQGYSWRRVVDHAIRYYV